MQKWSLILVTMLIGLALVLPISNIAAQEPALTVTKIPDKTSASLGDNITYTYTITNISDNLTVDNLTLTDDKLGAITLDVGSLAPGENFTAIKTYTVLETDFPGPIENTATVTGDSNGSSITENVSASVNLNPYTASLQVTKSADKTSAYPGDTITYTYTIINNGQVTIDNLTLTDSKLEPVSVTTTPLAPGESVTATSTYTVVAGDLPGPLTNTAIVTGTDPLGKSITSTSNSVSVSLSFDRNRLTREQLLGLTKFQILSSSGIPGKGLAKAPGLQKPFNPKSRAAERAGKKK